MRALTEFLVHKLVLSRQGLNVFSELGHLLSFELAQLRLLIDLLSEAFALLSESLDLLLASK